MPAVNAAASRTSSRRSTRTSCDATGIFPGCSSSNRRIMLAVRSLSWTTRRVCILDTLPTAKLYACTCPFCVDAQFRRREKISTCGSKQWSSAFGHMSRKIRAVSPSKAPTSMTVRISRRFRDGHASTGCCGASGGNRTMSHPYRHSIDRIRVRNVMNAPATAASAGAPRARHRCRPCHRRRG